VIDSSAAACVGEEIRIPSRDAVRARALFDSFPQKRGAERRKAHPTNVRAFSGRGSVPKVGARSPSGAPQRHSPAQSQTPLAQLQNHVFWDAAGAGVLPASGLSSPASSSQTGPFAGQVVPQSRPRTEYKPTQSR
jgi:hypothetical protein